VHLTALSNPELGLVELASSFLSGNEFVSWSEFLFRISGSQGTVLEVQSKLDTWRRGLSQDLKDHLILDRYFSMPYRSISEVFAEDGGDKTLPYLCLFQLGEYYNLAARLEEAFEVKKTVAEGLVDLLGERNPLSLKAESAFAIEYLGRGAYREAEETFGRLAQIQLEVLGEDRPDTYQSLQRQGMAQLWMTKYRESNENLTKSLAGFIRTVGTEHFLYLLSQLSLACVLEGQGEWRQAILNYERVWKFRLEILGPDNPMAVWSRCAMGSTYRKLGRYDEAEKALDEVIDSRTRVIGARSEVTVDAIIQQIVVFRDAGRRDEAMELVDFISDGSLADLWFERLCQVDHLRALLEADAGEVDLSRETLQTLVDQASEMGRNRSLLWVLLDLATILRRQHEEDKAMMLFSDLVTSIDSPPSPSSWERIQKPNELQLAEEALRLVRDLRVEDATLLLKENGLRWTREETFWIITGGPAADTGYMKRMADEFGNNC